LTARLSHHIVRLVEETRDSVQEATDGMATTEMGADVDRFCKISKGLDS
jgi:hypothetical protein